MPERPDEQIVQDAAVLSTWMQSEYFGAFERVLEDALEDASRLVLTTPVRSEEAFYACLEAKGRYLGLTDAMRAVRTRIAQGLKVREQMRGR